MNISIIEIFIPNGITRHIVLYDGIDGTELKDLLSSCFIGYDVIGLQNKDGIVYPLSIILRNPSNFGNMKFAAVVRNIHEELMTNSKPLKMLDTWSALEFDKEKSVSTSKSFLKLTDSALSRPDPIVDNNFYECDTQTTTIAEVKEVLGLGQFSAEFIVDFIIGIIADSDDDESSWLMSKEQFNSAISQLAYRQYLNFSSGQKSLSDYIVRNLFSIFDEESSGFCDLRELGCGLMLFAGGEIIDRAQMAYKLVAESCKKESRDIDDNHHEIGVTSDMMTVAVASVLKVVAILNNSYLNSCDPMTTAEEITKRAFIRAKLSLSYGATITQEDFEYWFSVVLTIYNEIEEGEEIKEKIISHTVILPKNQVSDQQFLNHLSIDTDSALYDADMDIENGDVRSTMPPNPVVLELQRAKHLLGLRGVAAEDLMELLGQVSSEGMLSAETWEEYLLEFVVGDKNEKKIGTELGIKLFRAFDKNDEEAVSYIDFCAGLSLLSDSPIEDKIMVAFVLNDRESVGMITVPELENLILGSLRVVVACSPLAAIRMASSGVTLENLSHLTVMEGLAVMELTYNDTLTLETVSEIALKCVALSAN